MKKSNVNLMVDIILLLLLAAVSGIGILMKYVMPSSYSVRHEGATSYASNILGMNRHEWGYVHWILSLLLLFFILLHIILHWKMITGMLSRMIPNKALCNTICLIIVMLILFFIIFPFLLMI